MNLQRDTYTPRSYRPLIRCISVVVIITFLMQDLAWAGRDIAAAIQNGRSDTLQITTLFNDLSGKKRLTAGLLSGFIESAAFLREQLTVDRVEGILRMLDTWQEAHRGPYEWHVERNDVGYPVDIVITLFDARKRPRAKLRYYLRHPDPAFSGAMPAPWEGTPATEVNARLGRQVLRIGDSPDTAKTGPAAKKPAGKRRIRAGHPGGSEIYRAESVYKDYFETVLSLNFELFINMARRRKLKEEGTVDLLEVAPVINRSSEIINMLEEAVSGLEERTKDLKVRDPVKELNVYVGEQIKKLRELTAARNEPAACAVLVGILNRVSRQKERTLSMKVNRVYAGRIKVHKENEGGNKAIVIEQGRYYRPDERSASSVKAQTRTHFERRWIAGRALDEMEEGLLEERDWAVDSLRKLEEARSSADFSPIGEGTVIIREVLSGMGKASVEEKRLAKMALEAVVSLIDIGETEDIRHLLPIAERYLSLREDNTRRMLDYVMNKRVKPFRNIVRGENAEFRKRTSRISSAFEAGRYSEVSEEAYRLLARMAYRLGGRNKSERDKDRLKAVGLLSRYEEKLGSPRMLYIDEFCEPDLGGLHSVIGAIVARTEKLDEVTSRGRQVEPGEISEALRSARHWIGVLEDRIRYSDLLNDFMGEFRAEYVRRRITSGGEFLKEDTFVDMFKRFSGRRGLTRGSPDERAFKILCYMAVFVPLEIKDPDVPARGINPIVKPLLLLRLMVEVDDIGRLGQIREIRGMRRTSLFLKNISRSKSAVSDLDGEEKTMLLRAMSRDLALKEEYRFEMAKAFAISRNNLRRRYFTETASGRPLAFIGWVQRWAIERGFISVGTAARVSFLLEEGVFAWLLLGYLPMVLLSVAGISPSMAIRVLYPLGALIFAASHRRVYRWREARMVRVDRRGDQYITYGLRLKKGPRPNAVEYTGFALLGAIFRAAYLFPGIDPAIAFFLAMALHAAYDNIVAPRTRLPAALAARTGKKALSSPEHDASFTDIPDDEDGEVFDMSEEYGEIDAPKAIQNEIDSIASEIQYLGQSVKWRRESGEIYRLMEVHRTFASSLKKLRNRTGKARKDVERYLSDEPGLADEYFKALDSLALDVDELAVLQKERYPEVGKYAKQFEAVKNILDELREHIDMAGINISSGKLERVKVTIADVLVERFEVILDYIEKEEDPAIIYSQFRAVRSLYMRVISAYPSREHKELYRDRGWIQELSVRIAELGRRVNVDTGKKGASRVFLALGIAGAGAALLAFPLVLRYAQTASPALKGLLYFLSFTGALAVLALTAVRARARSGQVHDPAKKVTVPTQGVRNVMILDDRASHRKAVREFYPHCDTIKEASTLEEAKKIIEENPRFDLVVSDLCLHETLVGSFTKVDFNGRKVELRKGGEAFVTWLKGHEKQPNMIILHSTAFNRWSLDGMLSALTFYSPWKLKRRLEEKGIHVMPKSRMMKPHSHSAKTLFMWAGILSVVFGLDIMVFWKYLGSQAVWAGSLIFGLSVAGVLFKAVTALNRQGDAAPGPGSAYDHYGPDLAPGEGIEEADIEPEESDSGESGANIEASAEAGERFIDSVSMAKLEEILSSGMIPDIRREMMSRGYAVFIDSGRASDRGNLAGSIREAVRSQAILTGFQAEEAREIAYFAEAETLADKEAGLDRPALFMFREIKEGSRKGIELVTRAYGVRPDITGNKIMSAGFESIVIDSMDERCISADARERSGTPGEFVDGTRVVVRRFVPEEADFGQDSRVHLPSGIKEVYGKRPLVLSTAQGGRVKVWPREVVSAKGRELDIRMADQEKRSAVRTITPFMEYASIDAKGRLKISLAYQERLLAARGLWEKRPEGFRISRKGDHFELFPVYPGDSSDPDDSAPSGHDGGKVVMDNAAEAVLYLKQSFEIYGSSVDKAGKKAFLVLDIPHDQCDRIKEAIEENIIKPLERAFSPGSDMAKKIRGLRIVNGGRMDLVREQIKRGDVSPDDVIVVTSARGNRGSHEIDNKLGELKNAFVTVLDSTLLDAPGTFEGENYYYPYLETVFFAVMRAMDAHVHDSLPEARRAEQRDRLWQWYSRIPNVKSISRDDFMTMCFDKKDGLRMRRTVVLNLIIPEAVTFDPVEVYRAIREFITKA